MTDIDDTLRPTDYKTFLPGSKMTEPYQDVKTFLQRLATEKNYPIVYLSAAPARMTWNTNVAFLDAHFPRGRLFQRDGFFVSWSSDAQAKYKAMVLKELRKVFPEACFLCIGDDKYNDPSAYKDCNRVFIRCVEGADRCHYANNKARANFVTMDDVVGISELPKNTRNIIIPELEIHEPKVRTKMVGRE